MSGTIRANRLEDVALLVRCFTTMPRDDEWKIAAVVYDLGLMRLQNWPFSLWLIRNLRGRQGVFTFWHRLALRVPDTVHQFIIDTADHIAHGHDREDRDSVGGLSQREIDLLLSKVSFDLLKPQSSRSEARQL